MIAFVSPIAGREEEFNKWYEGIHLPDALEVEGVLSATRLEVTDVALLPGVRFGQFQYVTLYDLEITDDNGFELIAERLRRQFFGGANDEQSKAAASATKERSSAMGPTKIAFLRMLGEHAPAAG
jgi:hypothetical protein